MMIPKRPGVWERHLIRTAWIRPSNSVRDANKLEAARQDIMHDKAPLLLVDETYHIIKGHHVYDAYISLGIPWIQVAVKIV